VDMYVRGLLAWGGRMRAPTRKRLLHVIG